MDKERGITVIGTGDFGCALAKKLIQNGYEVTIGSRSPHSRKLEKRNEILKAARVVSIRDSIMASNMVIVAIPCEHAGSLKNHGDLLQGNFMIFLCFWGVNETEFHVCFYCVYHQSTLGQDYHGVIYFYQI